ncbi:phosphatase PAP2 family protein [Ignavibacterium album]|uniref:phosphatase PAP2 family protein n=1 Tax=Ignavibacterium album TaxID=591197 RepID=UPI0026EEE023|nr:phosphatase PAP2 family protein [Ignavibacterium album]
MKSLLSVLLFFNITIYSQNTDTISTQDFPSFNHDLNSFFNTGKYILSAPSRFDNNDWITVGSIAALTGSAFLIDNELNKFWLKNKTEGLDRVSEIGRVYGEISFAAVFSGSLYLGGKLFGEKDISLTGRMLLEGLFYAGLTTTVIKTITGRSRPFTNEGDFKFRFFQTKNDFTSFPSGHTTVAFTLSTILSERINNPYASIVLYTLASSTVWQRMYSNNHWLSDTLLGASIGYFIGKAVVKSESDLISESKNNFYMAPSLSEGFLTININYSF